MTRFLLVRHAPHVRQGEALVGRQPGVGLDPEQRWRAVKLADRLAGLRIAAIQSSPRERALATADILAGRIGLPIETVAALDEIDYGAWTGRRFDALESEPLWQRWNAWRTGGRPPEGEEMAAAQLRIVQHMKREWERRPDATILMVGHGDPIRAALAHWLGLPLDLFTRLEISPASVSRVELRPWGPRVLSVNETAAWEDGA